MWKGSVRTGRRASLMVGGGVKNRTVPPLELLHLAAAANKVVETDMAFLCLFVFVLQLYHEMGWAGLGWAGGV